MHMEAAEAIESDVQHDPQVGFFSPINVNGLRECGTDHALAALYCALAEAQGEYEPIGRTKEVKITSRDGRSYTFEYAEMDEINRAVAAAHKAHGLCVLTPFSREGLTGPATFHVILAHRLGGRLHVSYGFVPGADVKDLGGQTTYLMRYLVSKLLRLHAEGDADDQPTRADEQTAEVRRREAPSQRQQPPKVPSQPQPQPKAQPQPQPAAKAAPAAPISELPPPPPVEDGDPGPAGIAPLAAPKAERIEQARAVIASAQPHKAPTSIATQPAVLLEIQRLMKQTDWSGSEKRDFCFKHTNTTTSSELAKPENFEAAKRLLAALQQQVLP